MEFNRVDSSPVTISSIKTLSVHFSYSKLSNASLDKIKILYYFNFEWLRFQRRIIGVESIQTHYFIFEWLKFQRRIIWVESIQQHAEFDRMISQLLVSYKWRRLIYSSLDLWRAKQHRNLLLDFSEYICTQLFSTIFISSLFIQT